MCVFKLDLPALLHSYQARPRMHHLHIYVQAITSLSLSLSLSRALGLQNIHFRSSVLSVGLGGFGCCSASAAVLPEGSAWAWPHSCRKIACIECRKLALALTEGSFWPLDGLEILASQEVLCKNWQELASTCRELIVCPRSHIVSLLFSSRC